MDVPEELRYSSYHEWVKIYDRKAGVVTVGLTDFAQDSLGEIVFVGLPAIDRVVSSQEMLGEVESTKSVSDVFSPVTGTVVEVNDELQDAPSAINADPYGEGWLFRVKVENLEVIDSLLSSRAYLELLEGK